MLLGKSLSLQQAVPENYPALGSSLGTCESIAIGTESPGKSMTLGLSGEPPAAIRQTAVLQRGSLRSWAGHSAGVLRITERLMSTPTVWLAECPDCSKDLGLGSCLQMDLGLAGKKAIVCAASRGLGRAVAFALAREGVNLVINARSQDLLAATAKEIRGETGVEILPVAADIATEAGREAVLAACPNPDILINNAGGPPPGDFRQVTREEWIRAADANMLTPIFLIRAVIDGMIERGFGRIVNITTSGVKSPGTYPQLGISIGVRSGLTGFVGVLSRQVARYNVTINGLLPGRFETDRLRENIEFAAKAAGHPAEEESIRVRNTIPAGRFGQPPEFGALAAFLCSIHAGYLTGQNIVVDGGTFPGLI